jgi:hypothetical protein
MSELASGQTTHSPHDTHHRAGRAGRHAGDPAEEVPAVSERVDRSAQQLAQKVWSTGAKRRGQLFSGMNQSLVEELLGQESEPG